MNIAISSSSGVTAALASDATEVGLHVLQLTSADDGLDGRDLSGSERALLPVRHKAEWVARFRAAKQLLATRDKGTTLEVEARNGEVVTISGTGVSTSCDANMVFAWTSGESDSSVKQ